MGLLSRLGHKVRCFSYMDGMADMDRERLERRMRTENAASYVVRGWLNAGTLYPKPTSSVRRRAHRKTMKRRPGRRQPGQMQPP